mgnify:FL=1
MQLDIIWLINYIDGIVWGLPMIILLVSTGVTLSILGGFFQIRKFPLAIKTMMWKGKKGAGEVHPFKIWAAVMGATIGVGNIAGASTAVHLGGPGAVFWMWVCALLGMATKSAEVTLGMWSRRVLPDGRIEGGTPYYVRRVPVIGPVLAVLFSLFAFIAAFGIGNMVQANNVALGAEYVAKAFGVETPEGIFQVRLAVGIIMLIATALVVLGGIRRIAEVANYMIPFMSAWYIIFGLGIWIMFGHNLGDTIAKIFTYAFSPMAAAGGLAGWSVYNAIRYGFARGLFSNEAGLGSAPNAYAFAESDHPGRQGFYGIFEVFMDTIVICTITVISDITTQAYIERPDLSGAALAMEAFFRAYGFWAPVLLGVALGLFAYTTVLTWEWYGEVNWRYFWVVTLKLPEKPMIWIWRVLWVIPIVPAAVAGALFETFWTFSDMTNGLMAIPNLIAIVYFAPVALRLLKDFYSRHVYETGEVSGGAAPATEAVKEFVKDFIRAMYTPTYKLMTEKRA